MVNSGVQDKTTIKERERGSGEEELKIEGEVVGSVISRRARMRD
jgi:hypothetical protein